MLFIVMSLITLVKLSLRQSPLEALPLLIVYWLAIREIWFDEVLSPPLEATCLQLISLRVLNLYGDFNLSWFYEFVMMELVGGATDAYICMLIFICPKAFVLVRLFENLLGVKGLKLLGEIAITSECLAPVSVLFIKGWTCCEKMVSLW